MSDILNEIDEDLRRDRAKELWKRYGKFVIAVAVVAILAVGGHSWWRSYERSQQLELAARYDSALRMAQEEDAPGAAADELAALANEASGGYALVARLRAAALKAEAGAPAEAAALYEALAADDSVDRLYRDLAEILAVAQAAEAGDGSAADLLDRLDPHLGEQAPWRFTAHEVAAGLAVEMGDAEAAREHLNAIVEDPAAPRTASQRASEILRAVGE